MCSPMMQINPTTKYPNITTNYGRINANLEPYPTPYRDSPPFSHCTSIQNPSKFHNSMLQKSYTTSQRTIINYKILHIKTRWQDIIQSPKQMIKMSINNIQTRATIKNPKQSLKTRSNNLKKLSNIT